MQPPQTPMTPYEEHLTQSYQMLNELRFQSALMYRNTSFCFDRCLDTEELYTLRRTTQAPIRYRLQMDLEEKQCVQHCGAKWEPLLQQIVMDSNEHAIQDVQTKAYLKMMQMMQQ
ncbi:putative mitochondrial hypothetical protein [Leptomonas pyrrhocoris]|uniref:Uncharacterized protein n=1 Tax=Leptomonas pyrrhocoris TaxID=157538 RepID=A0A0M9FV36_LEPPY|nr:putative mitochondrial hypothetical protein [Leptomonas pyrrhocoris]KPA76685.1 putative mitochondrial hypothetical protein [Leptomonas pyrrhocoris]|eukprot:XP_015655124.1 putative mitochondrial hypothetical protein [Leptomonas pyrrhocoris]